MLPGTIRAIIVVAAALAPVFAGVWGSFTEVRWAGTSISSTECRAHDYGREDGPGRLAEECEEEDQDDEDDRELLLAFDSSSAGHADVRVSLHGRHERHLSGPRFLMTVFVRGPPAAL